MNPNLARLAEATLERLGDNRALWFEGAWHTSGEMHRRATRVATGLQNLGVGPGDRVVVVMSNCPEVPILYNAIWRAGAAITPVVFLISAPELRHIVADAAARAIATTPELLPKVTEAITGMDLPVVVVGQDSYAALEAARPSSIVDRRADDLAALMYTGGTTGRSKGVALSHANLFHAGASSRGVSHTPGLNRSLSALPLSHSYGLLVTVGHFHAPEQPESVLQRWFDAAAFLDLAVRHAVQVITVVPSMLVMLLAFPLEDYDLRHLRHVYSGAAPLAPAVREEFQRRVPSATVLEGYGCTETGAIVSATPSDKPRPGTVGQAVAGVDIRILGLDGRERPVGEDGEVVVRGPNVMAGYWHGEAVSDGWFHTGDIGRLDADGYLTIVDRMKDLILRGGYNVYPRDVEDVLLQHPAVAMAAVVGRPDDRLGEEVVAFVSLAPGRVATEEELIDFARGRLAANKYPRQVTVVDSIPLTSVGKLDRKRLRATVR
jgi:long-chain acyl-CoA synthetase